MGESQVAFSFLARGTAREETRVPSCFAFSFLARRIVREDIGVGSVWICLYVCTSNGMPFFIS